ncbi:MAG: hypothetical protein EOP34_10955 [Rickettsiales bacterium]|nr:MAG: hypothetical protein EOP34_10955 [Rickettsiales bacterium]
MIAFMGLTRQTCSVWTLPRSQFSMSILYLNDLPKPKNYFCDILRLLFADDIIIYTITKNVNLANNAMNKYLNEIYAFMLPVNVEVCFISVRNKI